MTSTLEFSRDGGQTWETVGVADFSISGLDGIVVSSSDERRMEDVVVIGGGPFSISGKMQATFTCSPWFVAEPQARSGPSERPWLRPKKGRGRQL